MPFSRQIAQSIGQIIEKTFSAAFSPTKTSESPKRNIFKFCCLILTDTECLRIYFSFRKDTVVTKKNMQLTFYYVTFYHIIVPF